jgi:hypothetical protein
MTPSGGTSRDSNSAEEHDKTFTLYFLDQTWDLDMGEGKIALVVQKRFKVLVQGCGNGWHQIPAELITRGCW